jgi:glycosyltransferase involved in cell wall biosynthesis
MFDLRILVVAPSIWPVSDSRSLLATGLVMELAEVARNVTVLARNPVSHWPSRFQLGRAEVHRLTPPSRGVLDSLRMASAGDAWCREAGRWLLSHGNDIDLAIVIADEKDESGIVRALRRNNLPALVRIEQTSSPLLKQEQEYEEEGIRCVLPRACAALSGVAVIADGFRVDSGRVNSREALRTAMGEAHPVLAIPDGGPLAICSAPFEREQGVFELVAAWKEMTQIFPDARLWMVAANTGSDGHFLYQSIRDFDLMHSVVFPGAFDTPCDLVSVSDAVVLPSSQTPFDPMVNIANARRKTMIAHSGHPGPAGGHWLKFAGEEPGLAAILCRWASACSGGSNSLSANLSGVERGEMREMALQYLELARTIRGVSRQG